jgi:hypothetical protein
MARLARLKTNGSLVVIIKGEEIVNCINVNGKMQYPVTFFGEPEYVNYIIQNGSNYESNVGLKFDNLQYWSI